MQVSFTVRVSVRVIQVAILSCNCEATQPRRIIYYDRLPVLQISMFNFRSSSQDLVASSGQRRPAKPSLADTGRSLACVSCAQSTATCCTDCVMCP